MHPELQSQNGITDDSVWFLLSSSKACFIFSIVKLLKKQFLVPLPLQILHTYKRFMHEYICILENVIWME